MASKFAKPTTLLHSQLCLVRTRFYSCGPAKQSFSMAPTTKSSSMNRPIIFSGPSGAGKSTLLRRLQDDHPGKFGFSVSHTTRNPRSGESDGVHYHFITPEQFEALISEGAFIEYTHFPGSSKYYGTSRREIERIQAEGQIPVLDIEMDGVKQIRKSNLDARFLFIQPPDMEVLERRLRGRGTDAPEQVEARLKQAKVEMEYSKTPGVHDKIVINDNLDKAYEQVTGFVFSQDEVAGR